MIVYAALIDMGHDGEYLHGIFSTRELAQESAERWLGKLRPALPAARYHQVDVQEMKVDVTRRVF